MFDDHTISGDGARQHRADLTRSADSAQLRRLAKAARMDRRTHRAPRRRGTDLA